MTTKSQKFDQMNHQLRLYMKNSQRLFTESTASLHLTPQQARTLGFIKHNPGIIQRELADNFHLRGASIANMVKILERDGYIIRKNDPNSARVKRIYITEKGSEKVDEVHKIFKITAEKITHDLPTDIIEQLTDLLTDLNNYLEKING